MNLMFKFENIDQLIWFSSKVTQFGNIFFQDLNSFDFSEKCKDSLLKDDFEFLGDLLLVSDKNLYGIPNVNKKNFAKIKKILSDKFEDQEEMIEILKIFKTEPKDNQSIVIDISERVLLMDKHEQNLFLKDKDKK
jgi:hypothetical protein